MNKLVSVIIPVYNAEKYLEECIDSVINQTYKNIELILINDGSTDNSQDICERYKNKYSNINLFNITNHGVSYSRNFGISKSSGEYIIFIDADDYIEKNMIFDLVKIKEEDTTNTIIFNYSKVYIDNKVEIANIPELIIEKQDLLNNFFFYYNKMILNQPWNKLYDSKIIKKNNINFDINLAIGEDLMFNLEYFKYCNKFRIINQYYYNYRINPDSVTNKFRENYYDNQKYLLNNIKNFIEEQQEFNEEQQCAYKIHLCNNIINSIQNLFVLDCPYSTKEKRRIIKEIVSKDEVKYLQDIKYELAQLKILKVLVINKRINTIIVFSVLKEAIKKIICIKKGK